MFKSLGGRFVALGVLVVGCAARDEAPPPSPRACPQRGGEMVRLEAGPTDATFCIDQREVSQGQYAQFLAEQPERPAGSPSHCPSSPAVAPTIAGTDTPGCPRGALDFAKKQDGPMVCVSWCDAWAYCAWAGKRLCSGLAGTATRRETASDPQTDEWSAACTSGGKSVGAPPSCILAGVGSSEPKSTLRETECRGAGEGFDRVADMPGNVMEWTEGCEDLPFSYACLARGGSFGVGDAGNACALALLSPGIRENVGFRCCAD